MLRLRRLGFVSALSLTATSVVLPLPSSAATCKTVGACIFAINAGSGPGIEGASASGYGVQGVSNSGYGVEGSSRINDGVVGHTAVNPVTAGQGKAGVSGYDDGTNGTQFNSGVYGVSKSSFGVQGRSTTGYGVFAQSFKGTALSAVAGAPLYGGFTADGIAAQSSLGTGVVGVGPTTGVVGFATLNCQLAFCSSPLQGEIPSGGAITAGTDLGGLGLEIMTDANANDAPNLASGVGATVSSGGVGMEITPDRASVGNVGLIVDGTLEPRDFNGGFQGAIITGYNGVSVTADNVGLAVSGGTSGQAGSAAIVAQGSAQGATLFRGNTAQGTTTSELDDAGNLVLAGTLTQHGTIATQGRNSDGSSNVTFDARSTVPTIEDMGEATLSGGIANVALDASLAKAIDMSAGYLVFLTPQGSTTGLFVAAKGPGGFVVREIGGAHDSLAFDYRIVAHPFGERASRLASAAAYRMSSSHRHLFYRHNTPLRFSHGKLDVTSVPIPSS